MDVASQPRTNPLAIIGAITAFLLPPVGLVCSIIALTQIGGRGERGRGWAITGIVAAVIIGLLEALIIAAAISSSSHPLVSYHNADGNYTVSYPKGWKIETQNVDQAKSVIFKDEYKHTGKVRGQEEVVYLPPPANGYNADVLNAIRDSLIKKDSGAAISYQTRDTFKGLDSLRMIFTYNGENGKLKAKATILKKSDNTVYTIVTQAPEENWSGLADTFDEIHNTFQP